MCFTLYIGSKIALPRILWNKDLSRFNTRDLEDYEKNIPGCFSYHEVIYAGSDQGCGCGFRHALLTGNEWYPVVDEDKQEAEKVRKNHQALYDYIILNIKDAKFEIFACWNSDVNGGLRAVEEIHCHDLINEEFYFKEGGLYTIVI